MSSLSSFAAASIPGLIALLVTGCFFDASAFDSGSSSTASGGKSSGGGQATGGSTTGTGGSGAGTTASGGHTSSGGSTTTTTTPPECMVDSDCPDPSGVCILPRCIGGKCGSAPATDGTTCDLPLSDCDSGAQCMSGTCTAIHKSAGTTLPDDPKNCSKIVCDGNGNVKTEADPDDPPDSNDCNSGYCDGTTPMTMPVNEGGNCLFVVGKCCTGTCCPLAEGCCPNGACKYAGVICL